MSLAAASSRIACGGASSSSRCTPAAAASPRGRRRAVAPAASSREVTLLDYGAGNVRSVRNAIKALGFSIKDVRAAAVAAGGSGSACMRN